MIDSRSDEERALDREAERIGAHPPSSLGELNLNGTVADPTLDTSETFPGAKLNEQGTSKGDKIEIVKICGGSAWRVDCPFVDDRHPHRMSFTRTKERAKHIKSVLQRMYGPKLSATDYRASIADRRPRSEGGPTKQSVVLALYVEGKTTKEISEETGIRYQMCYNYIRKAGYEPHTKPK